MRVNLAATVPRKQAGRIAAQLGGFVRPDGGAVGWTEQSDAVPLTASAVGTVITINGGRPPYRIIPPVGPPIINVPPGNTNYPPSGIVRIQDRTGQERILYVVSDGVPEGWTPVVEVAISCGHLGIATGLTWTNEYSNCPSASGSWLGGTGWGKKYHWEGADGETLSNVTIYIDFSAGTTFGPGANNIAAIAIYIGQRDPVTAAFTKVAERYWLAQLWYDRYVGALGIINLAGLTGSVGDGIPPPPPAPDWPPGGTFPAGYVNGSGANAGWHVDATGGHDGTPCLTSNSITHNQTAAVEVTLTTGAGNVSFWRSVSSESSFDFLRFYVDGVQQGSGWSGSVPGSIVSFAVAAGSHVFRWVYSKDGSVSAGTDSASIDSVSFP